jgi:23S rRNA (pseudouridine1915-N3)-methyltransferase
VNRRIPERVFVSLLDREGDELDSVALSRWLEERRQSGLDLCFVIGGPFGLELGDVDHRLSLGRITLPHQLARVVLLEQVYRAHKILAGEPYHY